MTLFTIGFTQKTASHFFGNLRSNQIRRVIDVRLKNDSHIAGIARKVHLEFFVPELCGCQYEHRPEWAPSEELFVAYKKNGLPYDEFKQCFLRLITERCIEDQVSPEDLDRACLLCSEPSPEPCHRKLVAEYLAERFGNLEIRHL